MKTGNHYIPGRGVMPGAGFPDFVMFRMWDCGPVYSLQFVECKLNGIVTKVEKQKLEVLRKLGHKCFIAYQENNDVMLREFEGYGD